MPKKLKSIDLDNLEIAINVNSVSSKLMQKFTARCDGIDNNC